MPELPEVETVMRGLAGRLIGRVIAQARVNRADLRWKLPPGLAARLTGARVLGFRRRAKYILMRIEGGDTVLLHLGMSGRIVLAPSRALPIELHEHLTLETDDGWRVSLVDPRRFGALDLMRTAEEDQHRLLAGLGPEPLDAAFTPAVLSGSLASRRTPIKAALLDQRVVAGLGNIYVSEALFRAGISPRRLARSGAGRARSGAGAGDQGNPGRGRSPLGDRVCATTFSHRANSAISSTPGRFMAAPASRASGAPDRNPVQGSRARSSPAGAASIVRAPSAS